MATQTLNASTPGLVGWTAGPETRGTLTLVWSCVITIFACTWTVLHLNVPGRTEGAMAITLRKLKWMAINVLFPEFIFAKAVCDLRLALEELREFDVNVTQKKTGLQLCEWTVSHEGVSHEWSWEFEYPLWARGLYVLLGLTPPEPPFNEKPLPQWISRIFSLVSSNTKSPENSNDPEAQHSNGQKDPQTNRATPSHNLQEIANVSKYQDASSSREQEAGLSQTPQKASRAKCRMVQKWTVVHSYYSQMGGFLYQWGSSATGPLYYSCTASMLTERYFFVGDDCEKHLFKHLILSERDIRDKSKADWVLKGIAVVQVAWLILSVIVRSIVDLPITQLEIATIAFAVIAILSYAANWWKPKDISQATILETPAWGSTMGGKQAYTQSLKLRLLSPTEAAKDIKNIHDKLPRVPNDFVWMEGASPLIFTIMAISSLGFGGLHCIAWYFQFPSQAELLCWRIASVISATLPAATLGINLIVHFLVTSYTDYKLVSTLLRQLDPLKEVHAGLWARMKSPSWNDWSFEARRLIIRNPTGSRDWEKEPSKEMLAKYAPPEADATPYANYWNFRDDLKNFLDIWEKAQQVSPFEARTFQKAWFNQGSWMQAESKAELLVFWQEYEDFIKRDLKISLSDGHNTDCIAFILQAYNEAAKEQLWWESFKKVCDKASLILTIVSGVIYTAARLVILVLLFTCLRETPEGVYRVTPWLNFLPKFS